MDSKDESSLSCELLRLKAPTNRDRRKYTHTDSYRLVGVPGTHMLGVIPSRLVGGDI